MKEKVWEAANKLDEDFYCRIRYKCSVTSVILSIHPGNGAFSSRQFVGIAL
jgi:hypothetical protein